MNKRKQKKLIKKKVLAKHKSEHFFDRDKNEIYIPNDESISEFINKAGIVDVFHPSHKQSGKI